MKKAKDINTGSVVVSGMGVFNSIAGNIKEFSSKLKSGKSGIKKHIDPEHSEIAPNIYAKIAALNWKEACAVYPDNNITKSVFRTGRRVPLGIQLSLLSALEAFCQAKLDKRKIPPERQAIIIGGNNLTSNYQYQLYSGFLKDPEYLSPRYALHFQDTDQVGTLSQVFGIRGEGFSLGGASASGSLALVKARQLLQSAEADLVWVIGALSDLSPMDRQGFYNLGAMGPRNFKDQPQKACRPFDREAEGFIYGQGCGCIILENLESAQKRDAEILAEMAAGVIALAGHNLSQPDLKTEISVMAMALKKAGLNPAEIDYINSHGTSSPLGDAIEIQAIEQLFGENINTIWINATKGLIGHCLSAAGVIEVIATIIQLRKGFIHPNINLHQAINSKCNFSGSKAVKGVFKTALSNSFGFGGINSAIVLKK
jgi:malonyl-ACP decarboxylase